MKYYVAALAVSLLGACRKDNADTLVLTGEYQTAGTITANSLLLYTRTGEVKNPALVDAFLRRRRLGTDIFSRSDVPVTDNNAFTLTIADNGQATLVSTYGYTTRTSKAEVTSRTPQQFALTELDSSSVTSTYGGRGSKPPENRCDLLSHSIKTLYPQQRCKALPPTTGYSEICKFRRQHVVSIRDGKLFLPLLSWYIQATQPYTMCGLGSGNEHNTFNPAILSQLTDGDTIVVQQREVALLKK